MINLGYGCGSGKRLCCDRASVLDHSPASTTYSRDVCVAWMADNSNPACHGQAAFIVHAQANRGLETTVDSDPTIARRRRTWKADARAGRSDIV